MLDDYYNNDMHLKQSVISFECQNVSLDNDQTPLQRKPEEIRSPWTLLPGQ